MKHICVFDSCTYLKCCILVSEPPINLTATWNDEDQLTLTWNHPDITRGQLVGFYINITQIDSEIVRKNVYVVTPRYYAISKEDRSYSYTVNIEKANCCCKLIFNLSIYVPT